MKSQPERIKIADDLDQLTQEVAGLFQNKTQFVNPRTPEIEDEYSFLERDNDQESSSGPEFKAPIHGIFYNSGGFAPGVNLNSRHTGGHNGVDLRAPGGTPVYPMAAGVVTNVGTDPSGGNVVNIQHSNGIRTYSAHLGTITVHKGDKVSIDTQIGTVGDSGNAKGTMPHVHFQVWENGVLQDPAKYFSIPKYTNFDSKKEQAWLGDQYKQEAQKFNVSQHNAQARQAFSKQIERLVKIAEIYYFLSR